MAVRSLIIRRDSSVSHVSGGLVNLEIGEVLPEEAPVARQQGVGVGLRVRADQKVRDDARAWFRAARTMPSPKLASQPSGFA